MTSFTPYTIYHIYLDNTLELLGLDDEKGNYLVFWWKDTGLGELFIEPGKSFTEKEYHDQLIIAIKPTIEFYLKDKNISNSDWEYWITHKMLEEWNNWVELLLAKFTAAKIPVSVPVSVIICTRNRASQLQQC